MALALLKHYLENYYGSPRNSFFAMRPAAFSFERVIPFHRTATGLKKWLTTSGELGGIAEALALPLQEGCRISGRVLAKTKRETALSWKEIRGALELKAFSMGPQKLLRVRGVAGPGGRQYKGNRSADAARVGTAGGCLGCESGQHLSGY